MASGEMEPAEFAAFLGQVCANMTAFSLDGSLHFICIDWRHIGELLAAGRAVYTEVKNLYVWVKGNGGMGSLYRSEHELVFVFKCGRDGYAQRLHEDDLVGHVLGQEEWEIIRFPAIAEADEVHEIETILEARSFTRRQSEASRSKPSTAQFLDRFKTPMPS
jgi:hypothetical protein